MSDIDMLAMERAYYRSRCAGNTGTNMSEIDDIRKRHEDCIKSGKLLGPRIIHQDRKNRITLLKKLDALQAEIDMLMLEYCPEDMTEDQKETWGKYQVPISEQEEQT